MKRCLDRIKDIPINREEDAVYWLGHIFNATQCEWERRDYCSYEELHEILEKHKSVLLELTARCDEEYSEDMSYLAIKRATLDLILGCINVWNIRHKKPCDVGVRIGIKYAYEEQ